MTSLIGKICSLVLQNASGPVKRRLEMAAGTRALERLSAELGDLAALRALFSSGRLRRAIRPVQIEAPEGERILVYAPHQDDETIGSGGTLIRCVRLGKKVKTIYLTSGKPANKVTSQDAAVREEEARAVWKLIGGEEPEFWRLPCRELPVTEEIAARVRTAIDDFEADCVFIPSVLEAPLDHRRTALLLAMAHDLRPLPEPMEIWSYQVSAMHCPNVVVDITDIIEEKNAVNRLWESQNRVFDYAHFSRGMAAYNSIYLGHVPESPTPQRHAELFLVARPAEYLDMAGPLLLDAEGTLTMPERGPR